MTAPDAGNRRPLLADVAVWVAGAVFIAGLAALVARAMAINDGRMVYPLDDSYIGLALSEQIARGTYGVNPGEWSGPASTILWPFIVALFVRLPGSLWAPLVLNAACALAAIVLLVGFLRELLEGLGQREGTMITVVTVLMAVLLTNLLGVSLLGMEHGLQVLVAVAAGTGLVRVVRGTEERRWILTGALVLGPLVRYEALALTVPAALLLWFFGERRRAVGVTVTALVLLGLFSVFLLSLDVGLLPASLAARQVSIFRQTERLARDGLPGFGLYQGIGRHALDPGGFRLVLFTMGLGALSLRAGTPARDRALVYLAFVLLGLQVLLGEAGNLHRYEVYAWAALIPVALHLLAPDIVGLTRRRGPWAVSGLIAVIALTLSWPYVRDLPVYARASNDIYTQQYQMRRFLVEEHRAAVAVNDVGLPAYRNPEYVLDLMGLISPAVMRERRTRLEDPAWLEEATRAHSIELVMIFDWRLWFPVLPDSWTRVARLVQTRPRATSMGGPEVTFMATTPAAAERLTEMIERFAPSLPEGVVFEFYADSSAR